MTLPPDELEPPLQEKDFIQERYPKNPFPFWLWLVLGALAASLLWGGFSWYQQFITKEIKDNPFLQVTNRQMSLFLWQFPEHMRVNAKNKTNYLPGFQYQEKVSLDLGFAEDYVSAPPEILFLYHAWHRLLSKEFFQRPITVSEFEEFLNYAEEWKPRNWPKAPKEYTAFIEKFPTTGNMENLQNLSLSTLPLEVRMAFQGWKNFFKEGDAINDLAPTFEQLNEFLKEASNYSRNFWWNIVKKNVPEYLTQAGQEDIKGAVPPEQMTAFLKQGLFNYLQSKKEK